MNFEKYIPQPPSRKSSIRRAKFGETIYDVRDQSRCGWCVSVTRYYHCARHADGTYRIPHEYVRKLSPRFTGART